MARAESQRSRRKTNPIAAGTPLKTAKNPTGVLPIKPNQGKSRLIKLFSTFAPLQQRACNEPAIRQSRSFARRLHHPDFHPPSSILTVFAAHGSAPLLPAFPSQIGESYSHWPKKPVHRLSQCALPQCETPFFPGENRPITFFQKRLATTIYGVKLLLTPLHVGFGSRLLRKAAIQMNGAVGLLQKLCNLDVGINNYYIDGL